MNEHIESHNKLDQSIQKYIEVHTGYKIEDLSDDKGVALMSFLSFKVDELMVQYMKTYNNIKLKYE